MCRQANTCCWTCLRSIKSVLPRFYLWRKMCDIAYQALSQLVQQWEGPGDQANGYQCSCWSILGFWAAHWGMAQNHTVPFGVRQPLELLDLGSTNSAPDAHISFWCLICALWLVNTSSHAIQDKILEKWWLLLIYNTCKASSEQCPVWLGTTVASRSHKWAGTNEQERMSRNEWAGTNEQERTSRNNEQEQTSRNNEQERTSRNKWAGTNERWLYHGSQQDWQTRRIDEQGLINKQVDEQAGWWTSRLNYTSNWPRVDLCFCCAWVECDFIITYIFVMQYIYWLCKSTHAISCAKCNFIMAYIRYVMLNVLHHIYKHS